MQGLENLGEIENRYIGGSELDKCIIQTCYKTLTFVF